MIEDKLKERGLALKGSIRLLAEHAERDASERAELAEFAVALVDRVMSEVAENPSSPG